MDGTSSETQQAISVTYREACARFSEAVRMQDVSALSRASRFRAAAQAIRSAWPEMFGLEEKATLTFQEAENHTSISTIRAFRMRRARANLESAMSIADLLDLPMVVLELQHALQSLDVEFQSEQLDSVEI